MRSGSGGGFESKRSGRTFIWRCVNVDHDLAVGNTRSLSASASEHASVENSATQPLLRKSSLLFRNHGFDQAAGTSESVSSFHVGGVTFRKRVCLVIGVLVLGVAGGIVPALALGARSFKSGPIQITADGSMLWVVNPDHDSVTRVATATETVIEFPLPQPAGGPPEKHKPRGLSVKEDGSEVWVACHDSDRVYVLRGSDGVVLSRIDLPWGSGPYSVALSRDQSRALVTCLRSSKLAVIDVATRQVTSLLDCFRSPLGIAWLEDGVSAWITHLHVNDRLTRVSRLDVSGGTPRVTTQERTDGTGPQDSAALNDANPAHNIAEGGYLNFRGHLAQVPGVPGGGRVWVPTQYGNRNQTIVNPDSILQTTIRQIDLTTRRIPNTLNDKIILSAKQVHDPAAQNTPWRGTGWDAPVAGPVDIAFSSDGATTFLLNELSENLLVMPTNTPPCQNGTVSPCNVAAPPPVTVTVGYRPMGVAVAPVVIGGQQRAYVANILSRDVSVVNVTNPAASAELHRIAVTPVTPEPASAHFRNGERLFHSSVDPRASSNRKVACGSCHMYGEQDGRAWELQSLPGSHGPRQTQSILGVGLSMSGIDPATGLGQLHRSGDRDEVQDFDHTFRGTQMGGTGFIAPGSIQAPLGPANAGRSADLDDVAAYVLALGPLSRSPYRNADGSLSEAAVRGATMFLGSGARLADAKCATCHVPETGYVDHTFHDVGERHDAGENELNTRAPVWGVNTASLVGVWDSPPYVGAFGSKDPESMVEEVIDFRNPGRTKSHGSVVGLTGHQIADLAEFVDSIDGNLTAAQVRSLADTTRPRIVRVEPASLTRVDVWFSESIAPSAATPSAWRLSAVGGPDVAVTGAVLDVQNGDRVTLTVAGMHHDCGAATYRLVPLGPISDLADTASGGMANLLDTADPANTKTFVIGNTLTVTFGASGYENFTIPVHDAGTIFGLPTLANGSVWLRANGTNLNTDFLRFEWESAFASTGVSSSSAIVDASVSLLPYFGDSQTIEARRVLQRWWDHGLGDLVQTPVNPSNGHGGPTYRDSEFNVKAWNAVNAGARTAGINGASPSDYFGTRDTAFTPDATVTMSSIGTRTVLSGAGVLAAFRFWFTNPTLDQGYALTLQASPQPKQETKFHAVEEELHQMGPVLTITYTLPATTSPPPSEVSSTPASELLVSKLPAGLVSLSFQDLGGAVGGYNVYEGSVGSWYSHTGVQCGQSPPASGGRRQLSMTPGPGNRYFLVTAYDLCTEGTSGNDSAGHPRPPANLDCAP